MPTGGRASTSRSGGSPAEHCGAAQRQRGANGQRPATSSGAGHRALDRRELVEAALDRRLRQQEPERVRVERLTLQVGAWRDLEHRARVEDVDPAADRERDAQVVRDQDETHPTRLLHAAQQREDLLLRRHVERGRRLVGDQQLGIAGERGRDRDALLHAARELERVPLRDPRIVDPDLREPADRLVAAATRRRGLRRSACRS